MRSPDVMRLSPRQPRAKETASLCALYYRRGHCLSRKRNWKTPALALGWRACAVAKHNVDPEEP